MAKAKKEQERENLAQSDDLKGIKKMTSQEVLEGYGKMVEDYKEYIKTMTPKELEAEEQRIITIMDKWDKERAKKIYKLSDGIEWNKKMISRQMIGAKINKILDKFECEYKYTLGMWQMANWWEDSKPEIDFATLDSTLRVLGNPSIKYKGPQEWNRILCIDAYFNTCNEEYRKDTFKTYMLAEKHNALLDAMKINMPIGDGKQVEEQQEGEVMVETL